MFGAKHERTIGGEGMTQEVGLAMPSSCQIWINGIGRVRGSPRAADAGLSCELATITALLT